METKSEQWRKLPEIRRSLPSPIGAILGPGNTLLRKTSLICRSCTLCARFALVVTGRLLTPNSCVDSILINGKGKLDCPGEGFLVNHTTSFMKYALYPSHVNDKG